jgi:hypothetical protein
MAMTPRLANGFCPGPLSETMCLVDRSVQGADSIVHRLPAREL